MASLCRIVEFATRAMALAVAPLVVAGCSSGELGEKTREIAAAQRADFSTALEEEVNRLARPPSVITEVDKTLLRIDDGNASRLLPTVNQARLLREGRRFWLEIDQDPEIVWNVVREFWNSEGFEIEFEVPETGVIETDWRQDRSKILGIGLSRYFDIALERVNDTGERYKFRSRVERGESPGSSLVFISHRAIQETPRAAGPQFDPLPNDPTLEAEMLRRLMLRFRRADEALARVEDFEESATTRDLYEASGNSLVILLDREQAWQLLLQALDRSGYIIVASDKTTGSITIRTAVPSIEDEDEGFFGNLFGTSGTEGEPFEATIAISSQGSNRTEVIMPDGDLGETIVGILIENI